jgi:phospholipid/cholesterol/gamma-HCH transport system substrate-binding protein
MTNQQLARLAALSTLAIGLVALMFVLLTGGGSYTVHARFVNAGQLVTGDLVEVGGRSVGKITGLELTDDGQADVEMSISDGEFTPLHHGTVATIRAVGLVAVANRFVELAPGPARASEIPDGGVIDMSRTHPIVDLDAVLDGLDPPTRKRLQLILRSSSHVLEGESGQANEAFGYLNPALSQTAALTDELARDQPALERLVTASGSVASALASRRVDLEQGVTNSAIVLRALAGQRNAIADIFARSPNVLRRSRRTLRGARRTLDTVPATAPLTRVLAALGPTSRHTRPIVADLNAILPSLRRSLASLPALERETLPVVRDSTKSVRGALPLFAAFRPYSEDFISGFVNGLSGSIGGSYDANGEYARIAPLQGEAGTSGIASLLINPPGIPNLVDFRKGLTARCPGGAVEPAADRSNPWTDDASLCDPSQDKR